MNFLAGEILAFDKPYGWTSFQMVAKIRRLLTLRMNGTKIKVGHAGTLDPLATGVMIVCTGRATKQIESLQAGDKEYEATLLLGATTPSFDLEHSIDGRYPTAHITREALEAVLHRFEGEQWQVPPAFSACKVQGKRAYDLARRGKEVTLKAKPVCISRIELLSCELPVVRLRIACSKGTYIRSLARDIGLALGSGAHLTALRRTRIGDYSIQLCHSLDKFGDWLARQPIETELEH